MSTYSPRQNLANVRAGEREYLELRRAGANKADAREVLGLTVSTARLFEQWFHAERMREVPDTSCPRFSDNDAHAEAVLAHGGFPRGTLHGWVGHDNRPWGAR